MIGQITEFFSDSRHEYSIGGHKFFRMAIGIVYGSAKLLKYFTNQAFA
jgi:hypothetical protein